ncbi:hypothetical protein ACP4OV_002167 [Aristida adscensionis]
MEPAEPPSPSIFLNLPPTAQAQGGGSGDHEHDLQVLSRLLMEDNIMDKLSYQYPDDHPALLQAQRSYARILSDTLTVAAAPCYSSDNIDTLSCCSATKGNNFSDSTFLSNGTAATGVMEPSSMDAVSMAFFKGMEEASKFLPDGGRGQKKRLDSENEAEAEADVRRSSKQMAVPPQPELEEEVAAREMLERLMLNGRNAGDMRKQLRVDVEMDEKPPRRRDQSSPTWDGTQRLALEARLASTGSNLYRSLKAKRTNVAGILRAYQLFMADTCFLTMNFLFSNEIIYNVVAGRAKLHVVQYGLGYWFQWPELLRRLARREGGPPEVRLTGIDTPLPGFRPTHLIDDTGRRLSDCARLFGVPFKFHGIAARSDDVCVKDLSIDPGEVLLVNSFFHFDTLLDESVIVDRENPRDLVLSTIRKMKPKVFVHPCRRQWIILRRLLRDTVP